MATPSTTSGAEKLASILNPLIAEAQARQTKVMREFVHEEIERLHASFTVQIQETIVQMRRMETQLDAVERALRKPKTPLAQPPAAENPDIIQIKLQLEDITKLLTALQTSIKHPGKLMVTDVPDRVRGLPPNVLMRETGPPKNMFAREDDDTDLDFD